MLTFNYRLQSTNNSLELKAISVRVCGCRSKNCIRSWRNVVLRSLCSRKIYFTIPMSFLSWVEEHCVSNYSHMHSSFIFFHSLTEAEEEDKPSRDETTDPPESKSRQSTTCISILFMMMLLSLSLSLCLSLKNESVYAVDTKLPLFFPKKNTMYVLKHTMLWRGYFNGIFFWYCRPAWSLFSMVGKSIWWHPKNVLFNLSLKMRFRLDYACMNRYHQKGEWA